VKGSNGKRLVGSGLVAVWAVLAPRSWAWAQDAPAGPLGPLSGFVPFLLIFVLFYLLLILPQQRRQKKHRAMLEALKKNDKVATTGGIYGTVRQLVGMMDAKGSPDLKGMSVIYCVFGAETGAAFLALLPTPECFRIGDVDYHAVLIPSAPVPVGGSLLFVPASSVRPAGISVDAFMSIYVSMGVTGPQWLNAPAAKPA